MMTRDEWLAAMPEQSDLWSGWLDAGLRLWDDPVEMGNALKGAAHHALYDDLARSERLARGLIRLGERSAEARLIALGEMALADALRFQMRYSEAYPLFDQAAERFEHTGDLVGWARTRIGWLGHLQTQQNVPPLEPIIQRAAAIFEERQLWGWLASLCINYVNILEFRGDWEEQLAWCLRAHESARKIEVAGDRLSNSVLALLALTDTFNNLGRYDEAQQTWQELLTLFAEQEPPNHLYGRALRQAGRFYLNTGRYAQALFYLYEAERRASEEADRLFVRWLIAAAYRRLNRLSESESVLRDLLQQVSARQNLNLWEIDIRLGLAQVLSARRQWTEARDVLEPAIRTSETAGEIGASTRAQLYQQLALVRYRLGDREGISDLLSLALEWAEKSQLLFSLAETYLVAAEVAGTADLAEPYLLRASAICEQIPWLRWRVHHLYAQLATDPGARRAALARAADDLDTVQSSLAASFHADYLQEAESLYHELIAAHLREGDVPRAWATLERAKSRALLNSMMYQEERGPTADSSLAQELEQLQLRHYSLVRAQVEGHNTRREIADVEREIQRVQEALEVETMGRGEPLRVPPPIVPEAPPGTDMVGYYLVGEEVHAFVHNGEGLHHQRLRTSPEQLHGMLTTIFVNMRAAPTAPDAWIPALTAQLHSVLERLTVALLAPLQAQLRHEQLVVVPHGLLHQMPFHLLRHNGRYLIEEREVRVVPTARLARRAGSLTRKSGNRAVVVSHTWDGKLPQTEREGELVATILSGARRLSGAEATRPALESAMRGADVVHIAAHGVHRPDAPHLSYLQLEDGVFSVGDLFRLSLDSSLVTLSACDTGQAVVRAGDDPVGLWRGFLAAGACSLLVALWQLEDACALKLMGDFYRRIVAGVPKAAALRLVQCEWLEHAEGRLRHPFYWGALQLIGDDGRLTLLPEDTRSNAQAL